VATTGAAGQVPYGGTRLLAGTTFSLGLILVVVGGAELFTGNNLIVMAWASGKVTSGEVLRNWSLVYAGNFAGAVLMAVLILWPS
jgi:formate transporter